MLDTVNMATVQHCLESHSPVHFSLHYSLQTQSYTKSKMVNHRLFSHLQYSSEKLDPMCQYLENEAFLQKTKVSNAGCVSTRSTFLLPKLNIYFLTYIHL